MMDKGEIVGIAQDIIFLMNSPISDEGKKSALTRLIEELRGEIE